MPDMRGRKRLTADELKKRIKVRLKKQEEKKKEKEKEKEKLRIKKEKEKVRKLEADKKKKIREKALLKIKEEKSKVRQKVREKVGKSREAMIKRYDKKNSIKMSYYDIWKEEGELEHILITVRDLTRSGYSLTKIAETLEIHPETLLKYVREKEDFREAHRKGKFRFEARAVDKLIELAEGYTYEEEIAFLDVKRSEIVKTTIKKHKAPCYKSIKTILEQRRPDEWNKVAVTTDNTASNIDKVNSTLQNIYQAIEQSSTDDTEIIKKED